MPVAVIILLITLIAIAFRKVAGLLFRFGVYLLP